MINSTSSESPSDTLGSSRAADSIRVRFLVRSARWKSIYAEPALPIEQTLANTRSPFERLARSQLDDRDGAPRARRPLAVIGIRGEDLIRELPEPGSLRLVIDDLRVERPPAELDVGMGAK